MHCCSVYRLANRGTQENPKKDQLKKEGIVTLTGMKIRGVDKIETNDNDNDTLRKV